jgi:mevalonate kinase
MPIFTASAPGKVILFGEHAVVYGQPAIAVPVTQVRAKATVMPNIKQHEDEVRILAPDVGVDSSLENISTENPIRAALESVRTVLGMDRLPACTIKINSTIPVASGLGSGAAVSVALIRALSAFLGHPMLNDQVSTLAYQVEKIHHGTPSGIDNTVVTYEMAVFFIKGEPVETFENSKAVTILIADTGIPAPTRESVQDVRAAWQKDPLGYDRIFAAIGSIVKTARQAMEGGHPEWLGPLMDENHGLLKEIGVSSPALDHLVRTARDAGALGAKLSGGGRGGNMIALVDDHQVAVVAAALKDAGAIRVINTRIEK